jgi:hypothetical protein
MRRLHLAILLCVACGDDAVGPHPEAGNADAPFDAPIDGRADAPIDASPRDAYRCATDSGAPAHTIYLAVDGVNLVHGNCDDATTNCTSLISADVAVPPLLPGNANRGQIISDLVSQLQQTLLPYDVDVTTTRPATGPYMMIVVGGTCSQVTGSTLCSGIVTSFGTQDCGNQVPSDIGLVFDLPNFTGARWANVVMFEIGFAIGADTTSVQGDCMCQSCGGLSTPCTLGIDVPIFAGCSGGTQDETRIFATAFGCR